VLSHGSTVVFQITQLQIVVFFPLKIPDLVGNFEDATLNEAKVTKAKDGEGKENLEEKANVDDEPSK
jgi:hypothetical protein